MSETTDELPPTTTTTEAQSPPAITRQVSNVSMPKVKSGIFGTSSNLVNSIVGAGIIGIPYAVRNAGIIAGILLLILVSSMTDKSLRILIEVANFHPKLKNLGVHTYEDLMSIPFGRAGTLFVLINMFILAYGAMLAYLIIIKDTVPVALGFSDEPGEGDFMETEMVMVVTSMIIIVPLSIQRDMAMLSFTSFSSVLADVFLVILVALFAPYPGSLGDILKAIFENAVNSRLFIGLGVLSTAMACQHSAFIVSGSLDDRTPERWSRVTFRSISIAWLLCTIMGTTGYLGFEEETKGDILNNFDDDSKTANGGRILLAITMFFTYPMEMFVARHVIVQLFLSGDMDGPNPNRWCNRRVIVTLSLYVATLIPALFLDDLGPVLSLTGSIGASCVSYISTGLVYLGINGEDFLAYLADHLRKKGYQGESGANGAPKIGGGEVELPVVGDATARIEATESPAHADLSPLQGSSKPWWWWVGGFPLWVAIASTGAHGTRTFLADFHGSAGPPAEDGAGSIGPRQRDYYVSMFFIAFGLLAAVVGVFSSIYVEIHNIFYSPH